MMDQLLFEAQELSKDFVSSGGIFSRYTHSIRAVDKIDIQIHQGETLGMVGESGCGKTTVARLMMRLTEPTNGSLRFKGDDLLAMGPKEMRTFRTHVQMIFQDPYSFLNTRKTVLQIIRKPLQLHTDLSRRDIRNRTGSILDTVGLSPPELFMHRYPHELSGGQRQRVGIARAITLNPEFIIADEPVSALDVSVRSQILNLLKALQEEHNLTYLFISHDLSVVRSICDRVAVMYLGRIVEIGSNEDIFARPVHPYTRALLSSTPIPDPRLTRERESIILEGEVPDINSPPLGCHFHPRCPMRDEGCDVDQPGLREIKDVHFAACHYPKLAPIFASRKN